MFELMDRLGLSGGRSFFPPERLPPSATVWWIEPDGVCSDRIAQSGSVDRLDSEAVIWRARQWIEAGGTALVLLDPPGSGRLACDVIADLPVPQRSPLPPLANATEATLEGALVRHSRELAIEGLMAFEEPERSAAGAASDWSGRASFVGGPAFVLEAALGEGRLVVVADSRFVHNEWLDRADSAPLVIDLVAAYGEPLFDEREHGFIPEPNSFRYLAGSPASPVFAGLLVLGLVFFWRGTALPARSVVEYDPSAPTLENFVESMATLYARTRDYPRVLERYRELTAARLRQHFGLPREVPLTELAERIDRDSGGGRPKGSDQRGRGGVSALDVLTGPRTIGSAGQLRAVARELDALLEEVTR